MMNQQQPQTQGSQGINALMGQSQPMQAAPQQPPMQSMQPTKQSFGPANNVLPPDLGALLQQVNLGKALEQQKMMAERAAAQRNMQMQQPQNPPTVAQAEAQRIAGLQQQVQGMQQPQAAGIDTLKSGLKMAGGGIVGYSGENGSYVEDPEEKTYADYLNERHAGNETSIGNKLRALAAAGMDLTKLLRPKQSRPEGLAPFSEGETRRRSTENMDARDLALKLRGTEMQQASYSNEGRNAPAPEPQAEENATPRKDIAALLGAADKGKQPGAQRNSMQVQARTSGTPSAGAAAAEESVWEKENMARYKEAMAMDPDAKAQANAQRTRDMSGAGVREQGARDALAQTKAAQEKAASGVEENNSAFGIKGLGAFLRAGAKAPPTTEGGWAGALSALGQASEGSMSARDKATAQALANDKELIALRAKVEEARAGGMDQQADAYQKQLSTLTAAKAQGIQQGIQNGTQQELKRAQIASTEQIAKDNREARSADLAMRYAEMGARAKEVAASRGDKQSEMALASLERAAQAEGSKRAIAESKLLPNMDMAEVNTRAGMYAAQILQENPRYQAQLAKMGISMDTPKTAPAAAGWSAKIKQ